MNKHPLAKNKLGITVLIIRFFQNDDDDDGNDSKWNDDGNEGNTNFDGDNDYWNDRKRWF